MCNISLSYFYKSWERSTFHKEYAMRGTCSDGFFAEVKQAVRESMAEVLEIAKPEGYSGGYFCLKVIGAEGFLIEPMLVGEIEDEKGKRSLAFCQEKAHQLEKHVPEGHVLSRQSRNPENNEWGGAILIENGHTKYIFSFSGLPEDLDEITMLRTVYVLGRISQYNAIEMAMISGIEELFVRVIKKTT